MSHKTLPNQQKSRSFSNANVIPQRHPDNQMGTHRPRKCAAFLTRGTYVAVNEKPSTEITDRQREAIASLTPRERDCLRLAGRGYHQTKEIALRLDISEDRVNKLMQSARKKLGAATRGEAVRRLIDWEAQHSSPTQFMASPSLGLPELEVLELSRPVDDSAAAPDTTGDLLTMAPDMDTGKHIVASLIELVPLRTSGRQTNDLSIPHTLIAFAVIAVGALVAIGSAVSLLTGMNSLLHH